MKKNTLALVMIVKNEELGLERAILSALPICDEIVIAVDNSSTDKTEEIAKKYATTLKHFDWKDDFAGARNFAHAGVKSDWILFLDGHEYIKECPKLAEKLDQACQGLLCTVEMETGSQFRNPRLYRNGVNFEGQVHEAQKMSPVFLYPEFVVKHDRAGGQSLKSSLERGAQRDDQTVRIMSAQLERDPRNIRAALHLGFYFEGRGQCKKAIKYFNQYLKYSTKKSDRWFVFFNRALCHLSLHRCFRAFWSADRANDETPDRWEVFKLKGLIYFEAGKYRKAIEAFVGSFKINTGDVSYKPWPRDDAGTWNLIGECFYRLGDYYKANIAFETASKRATDEMLKMLTKKRAELMTEIIKKIPL